MLAQNDTALVPVVGLGTDTATVQNVRTREKVRLKNVFALTMVNRVVCVRLPVLSRDGDEAMVLLPGDRVAWVRPLATELVTA